MIFKPAARYPADPRAIFILGLSVFTGVTALALDQAPDSLNELLPRWTVLVWGILLTLGSLVTLVGMASQTIWGIITEQVGCVTVAATTIFYAGVVLAEFGLNSMQGTGVVLAWGLSCGVRWVQLQFLLHNAQARVRKRQILDRLDADIRERLARKGFEEPTHPEELTGWVDR